MLLFGVANICFLFITVEKFIKIIAAVTHSVINLRKILNTYDLLSIRQFTFQFTDNFPGC